MTAVYKMYAVALAERLREEIKGKGLIPHNQTGFRKGMGTIDNIYTINFLITRQIGKKGGKLIAMFLDLKAASDSVDREVLLGAMRELGIREGLRGRASGERDEE